MSASDYVDEAVAVLGGEDADFLMSVKPDGLASKPAVLLTCRYQGCEWGESVGEMELWEFITDARDHWETTHRTPA